MKISVPLSDVVSELNRLLKPELFRDYAPNGLQVESGQTVSKIITGVTASEALIDAAIEQGADGILVHHGYFWKQENPCITGFKARRIKKLLEQGISLLAYHLPLDANPDYGNNAELGRELGVRNIQVVKNGQCRDVEKGNTQLIFIGDVDHDNLDAFGETVKRVLNRTPTLISSGVAHPIKRVAWCTGAAQDGLLEAMAAGADVYLSGEISERTYHEVKENGIDYVSAGHHATERFGVIALASWLQETLGLESSFIDIDNPV